ncbi:amidase [Rhizobium sp. AG855]|uniref:amidase n=1 Tax=Rhizobium sp. AG855 TaxID=2183898 RepID=UPI000E7499FB|nr:amidase [Rhizobium sp. AG855]RKE78170.1 amidase [Rhizobium sp. AG855]
MKPLANAFLPYPPVPVASAETGPLAGLRLAVKDLFDVKGYPTAAGNPYLLAGSGIKEETAPLVRQLLDLGASFVGKTHTDELAYSLIGNNLHFGMPINPSHPELIPGGSSSGSAVAVASGLADIGLGTDTSGSIRLPATANGLFGWRPSFGLLDPAGVRPLAPSFDVPGLFTRDYATLRRVMQSLGVHDARTPSTILIVEDLLSSCDQDIADAFWATMRKLEAPVVTRPSLSTTGLPDLARCFTTILQKEAWQTNQVLFERARQTLAPDIVQRLISGREISHESYETAVSQRARFRQAFEETMHDAVLVMPTLPTVPPRRDDTQERFAAFRARSIEMLCIAGLSGCPQITMPLPLAGGEPAGISLIAAHGFDATFVEGLATRLA